MTAAKIPQGLDSSASPFHADELAVQEQLGVRVQMHAVGRSSTRDYMPEQHRQFFGEQPFFFVGALDFAGQPWATMLVGAPGFMSTPDERTLRIAGSTLPGDPLSGQLHPGSFIGGLGMAPATRRRNRVNGIINTVDQGGITVAVTHSFGNCPQYIQSRQHNFVDTVIRPPEATQVLYDDKLSEADVQLIGRADTFFIASANVDESAGSARGVDVSHRGGRPGFVRMDDDRTLTAPDFVGNFFFNTLGNLLHHPRAGLLFIDYDSGDLLHLAVEAQIIWDGPQVQAFAGAERLVRFHIREVRRNVGVLPLRWTEPEAAPQLERTGTWAEADRAMAAAEMRNTWRHFMVVETQPESDSIRSFYLQPADGLGVAHYVPGQFIPIRVRLPGHSMPQVRTYSLSDAPDGRRYRISVKRDGAVSSWLHEHMQAGGTIELMGPRGDFTFDASSRRSAVLLSAGVGLTPMIAMLNSLLVNGGRTRHAHPIYFIHAARNRSEHAFAEHVRDLAARHWNLTAHVRYSALGPVVDDDGVVQRFQHSLGRVDIDFLKEILPFDDYDFYLCGPVTFMQNLYDGLRSLNVASERIRFEAFSPASVQTGISADKAPAPQPDVSSQASIPVRFAKSGKFATWNSSDGSLLDFAEEHGMSPQSGCRSGLCGACATPLLEGSVDYIRHCAAQAPDGQVLICSATPKLRHDTAAGDGVGGITLDL